MEERVVTLTEVKEMLEKAEADRGELTYEQKLALEHARRFARFTPENLQKLLAELKQNPKVDTLMAVRIADMAPMHADDVRALFAKARTNLDESEVQKVLESVRKYLAS
jgi:DNA-directed RNA polymerase subunit F